MKTPIKWLAVLALGLAGSFVAIKKPDLLKTTLEQGLEVIAAKVEAKSEIKTEAVKPPAVSAVRIAEADFTESVLVTGSLVAREEILVAPEVEGFKVVKINVDQGDRVKKGDVLATLVAETLDAQLAQNTAATARAAAAIAQAKSNIVEAEARQMQANNDLDRARPLVKQGYMTGVTFDQRNAAAKTTAAQVAAAKDAFKSAEAAKAEVDAQRKEISWRRQNTDVRAPAAGIISRRGARLGAIATAAGAGEPLFRIIQNGEIELDAEVSEAQMAKLKTGQTAVINCCRQWRGQGHAAAHLARDRSLNAPRPCENFPGRKSHFAHRRFWQRAYRNCKSQGSVTACFSGQHVGRKKCCACHNRRQSCRTRN